VNCSFRHKGEIPSLPPEKETHLCKIGQEAIHNGVKHGKAARIQILLAAHNGCVEVSIKNNGRPFPAVDKLKAGTGLRIMNYRAHVIGGSLEVRSLPHGTEVLVRLPLISNGA